MQIEKLLVRDINKRTKQLGYIFFNLRPIIIFYTQS